MSRGAGVARVVTRPRIVQWSLRPVEDTLWRLNEVARREQERNQAEAAAFMPVLIQQVTENVIAQIDFVRVVQQDPDRRDRRQPRHRSDRRAQSTSSA